VEKEEIVVAHGQPRRDAVFAQPLFHPVRCQRDGVTVEWTWASEYCREIHPHVGQLVQLGEMFQDVINVAIVLAMDEDDVPLGIFLRVIASRPCRKNPCPFLFLVVVEFSHPLSHRDSKPFRSG